jgi:hypothetical protein
VSGIKPCPFCGSEADTLTLGVHYADGTPSKWLPGIQCSHASDGRPHASIVADSIPAAVAAWNTRAGEKAEAVCDDESDEARCGWTGALADLRRDTDGVTHCPACGSTAIVERPAAPPVSQCVVGTFDEEAEEFRRQTGLYAPGKDTHAAAGEGDSREIRQAAWSAWRTGRRDLAALRAEVARKDAALRLALPCIQEAGSLWAVRGHESNADRCNEAWRAVRAALAELERAK